MTADQGWRTAVEPAFGAATDALGAWIVPQGQTSQRAHAAAVSRSETLRGITLATLALEVLIWVSVSPVTIRHIHSGVTQLRNHIRKWAEGELHIEFSTMRRDELGEVAHDLQQTLDVWHAVVRAQRAEGRRLSEEMAALQSKAEVIFLAAESKIAAQSLRRQLL
jgi:methyl-accepting chemotaxis protein